MSKPGSLSILLCLLLGGCITAVTPDNVAKIDLSKSGLVLASISRSGDPDDSQNVTIEFYLRSNEHRENFFKTLVINSSRDLWLIEVPLGHYSISDWYLGSGAMRHEYSDTSFEFDVLPEEVTYIGHFDVQVWRAKNTFGLKVIPQALPILRDDFEVAYERFRREYPTMAETSVRNAAPGMFTWGATESITVPIHVPVPSID